jgi:hypothetical protein
MEIDTKFGRGRNTCMQELLAAINGSPRLDWSSIAASTNCVEQRLETSSTDTDLPTKENISSKSTNRLPKKTKPVPSMLLQALMRNL